MVEIIRGLHVGGLSEVNSLFSSKFNSESLENDTSTDLHVDSVDNVSVGVVTVCQDIPHWCSIRYSHKNKHTDVKNEHLNELYNRHFPNQYINLHFDLVYTSESRDNEDHDHNKPIFLIHSIILADDKPDERLYKAFQFAYEFFEYLLSQENGFVFVHCYLGMCRSTSLICSYLMRWKKRFLEVKKYMKSVHPKTAISHYFEYQMILYYKNGFKINDENIFYNYYIKTLDNYLQNRHNLNLEDEQDPQFIYSCKLCRETLFCDTNIINHSESSPGRPSSGECNSIFIEPMTWMRDLESSNGKLFCSNDKCNSKLGSFSWHGRKCSCGHLQVPAFQVQLSKVDRFDYYNGSSVPSKDESLQVK